MKTVLNGIEIAYEVRNPEGPRGWVALLNGVMASYSSWKNLTEVLENRGYRILLHDLRGQLLSEKPQKAWTWEDHTDDFTALLDHLEIEQTHLIGTSYGGELALCFTLACPARVLTNTIIDSVSRIDPHLEASAEAWITAAETGDTADFFKIIVPTIYGETFIRKNREFLKQRSESMADLPGDYLRGQIQLYRTFLTLDITDSLEKINAPTLVICGNEDTLKPPRYSKLIADRIPDSRYITIPDCGHVTFIEKPDELALSVLGFLDLNQE